jgi:tripartite-type tricarboxylate transporter receptor subunit TctC
MTKLRLTILILAVTTFAWPRNAAAEWPERPVHFIVPFPAGGATDVAARFVGNFLSGTLGQQIVVEGAGGFPGGALEPGEQSLRHHLGSQRDEPGPG